MLAVRPGKERRGGAAAGAAWKGGFGGSGGQDLTHAMLQAEEEGLEFVGPGLGRAGPAGAAGEVTGSTSSNPTNPM